MPNFSIDLPLSLYVHIPWCVRKCPYCDFNSHESKESLPETLYVNALMQDLESHLHRVQDRPIVSIFFGGGTPSLFSAQAIERILEGTAKRLSFAPNIEITLEANPGTIDTVRFKEFRKAGINRLSLGIQSLQNDKLKTLGRIHDRENALRAISLAQEAGFTNFNLDLMYGLPHQSIDDALHDIETALSFQPTHLSWYQLTIEPNTLFYHQTPPLPGDDALWDMQMAGQTAIHQAGYQQYEVSAYAKPGKECVHNRNYWEFGDYLGIGAGAHSKMTDSKNQSVHRFMQVKHPKDYLDKTKRQTQIIQTIAETDLIFEFMLNALRLTEGVPAQMFTERTGLSLETIRPLLDKAKQKGLLVDAHDIIRPSALGHQFLNNLVTLFLKK